MTIESQLPQDSAEDELFAVALDDYYRRLKVDGVVDHAAFLNEYAGIRRLLEEFFADAEQIDSLLCNAVENHTAVQAPIETLRYFGEYELLSEVARGGMGVIYKARQKRLDRIVAVKMILAGQLASADDVARFHLEAMAVAKLEHPNIVGIYEVGEHEGQHYYSMEYVDGDNLAELVKQQLFEVRKAAQCVQTIATALAFIHNNGLLHRDLKSSNVLIARRSGEVRITDFGLAKRTDAASLVTSTAQVLGTPSYMSPEQAAGRNDLVGVRSDVYSIGAILYELITGRPPFRGETPWDTAAQVINVDVVAPSVLRMKLPRDLETICLKCLRKEMSKRYQSAQELADDLGRFLRGEPIRARPVRRLERIWRWCRRNPALALANAMAVIGFLGLLISLKLSANEQQEHAETLKTALDVSESRLKTGNFRLSEIERDQALRLCAQGDIDQGCLWLVRSLETAPPDAVELRRSICLNLGAWQRELCVLRGIFPGQNHGLIFSPDSKWFTTSDRETCCIRDSESVEMIGRPLPQKHYLSALFFGSDEKQLVLKRQGELCLLKYNQNSWTERKIPLRKGGILGLLATIEQQLLVAYSTNGGIRVENALTGEQQGKLLPSDQYHPGQVYFAPDGRYVLTQPERGRLVLSDLKEHRRVGSTLIHLGRVELVAFSADGQRFATACLDESTDGRMLQVQIWDTPTGDKLGPSIYHPADGAYLDTLFFADGDKRLFLSTRDKQLRVWDLTGKFIAGPLNGMGRVRGTADGRLVASTSDADEARIFDVDTKRFIGQPIGRLRDSLSRLEISPNGQHVLVGTPQDARLWAVPERGLTLGQFSQTQKKFDWIQLSFSADGKSVLSCNRYGNSAEVWDVATGKRRGRTITGKYGFGCTVISPDGRWVVTGSGQKFGQKPDYRSLYAWNAETGEAISRNLPTHQSLTNDVVFSADGKRLISVGDSGDVFVYDFEKDALQAGPVEHPGLPELKEARRLRIVISPDQLTFAVFATYEDSVSLWSMTTGQRLGDPIQTLPGITEVEFGADSQSLVTAGTALQIWESIHAERSVQKVECPAPVTAIAPHPDGKRLAVAYEDRMIRFLDLETKTMIGQPLQLDDAVQRVAFAADGNLIVAHVATGVILFDMTTRVQVGPKFSSDIFCRLSPDRRTIAGGAGCDIRFWRLPESAADDVVEARRRIELNTGRALGLDGVIQPLSLSSWEDLKSH